MFLRHFQSDERGQELIEYALLVAMVALSAGAVIPPLSASFSTVFSKVVSVLLRFG